MPLSIYEHYNNHSIYWAYFHHKHFKLIIYIYTIGSMRKTIL